MARHNPSHGNKTARILIVDDHPVVRFGLAAQIATQPDLHVCGEAEDVAGAMTLLAGARPDVMVIDISLKSGDGLDLIKRIADRDDSIRVVVYSMHAESHYAERALHAGALAYVHKGSAAPEILHAIRSVLDGKVYVSENLRAKILGRLVGGGQRSLDSTIESLSDRELEAFRLMGEGLMTEEIAEKMHISPKTVVTYRARIKEKLGVGNMAELIHRATQWLLEDS